MVYRKLHQNVAIFRRYIAEKGAAVWGRPGKAECEVHRTLGRWYARSNYRLTRRIPPSSTTKTRIRISPYGGDPDGAKCPLGAHIRRVHPRDAFGFNGGLVNRRRIMRRGLTYGEYVPEGQPVNDSDEHGIIFIALNASLYRQFEFVHQQWIEYGNDAHQGNANTS